MSFQVDRTALLFGAFLAFLAPVHAQSPVKVTLPSEADLLVWEKNFKPGAYELKQFALNEAGQGVSESVVESQLCLHVGSDVSSGLGHMARFPGWEMQLRACQVVSAVFTKDEYSLIGACMGDAQYPVHFNTSAVKLMPHGKGFARVQNKMVKEGERTKLLSGQVSEYTYRGPCADPAEQAQGMEEGQLSAAVLRHARQAIKAAPAWAPKFKAITYGYAWKEGGLQGESLNIRMASRDGLVFNQVPIDKDASIEMLTVGSVAIKTQMRSSVPVPSMSSEVKALSLQLPSKPVLGAVIKASMTVEERGKSVQSQLICKLGAPFEARTIHQSLAGTAYPCRCHDGQPTSEPEESIYLADLGAFLAFSAPELFDPTNKRVVKIQSFSVEK